MRVFYPAGPADMSQKCPHCDVSLSLHRGGKMVCHYCGYTEAEVSVCPSCGSRFIGAFRAGTQQIEDMVRHMFPQAKVLRMDMDTTRKRTAIQKYCPHSPEGMPIF